MAELQAVYEAIWGGQLDAANFPRSLVGEDGWMIPTGGTVRPGRAAEGPLSFIALDGPGSTAHRSIASSRIDERK
jgi:8-oxo-dGTP diphosphatase